MSGTAVFFQTVKLLIRKPQQKINGQKLVARAKLGLHSTERPHMSPYPIQFSEMGGAKSVTSFFITSVGSGNGGNLGGLAGADAHCQALAAAEYAGDHTWRAYLSAVTTDDQVAVNARDRIGDGPWYNAEGLLIAANVEELHGGDNRIDKLRATTKSLNPVNGVGDTPNMHDIMTGSQADGTTFPRDVGYTRGNWNSSDAGHAQLGRVCSIVSLSIDVRSRELYLPSGSYNRRHSNGVSLAIAFSVCV